MTHATNEPFQKLPFGIEFQQQLLKLVCGDPSTAALCSEYLEPRFFQNEALAWAFQFTQRYREEFGSSPSMMVILNETRKLDPDIAGQYAATLEATRDCELTDLDYLKSETLEFIRRNIFARAHRESQTLYNEKRAHDAYDLMRQEMAKIDQLDFRKPERSFFFEEYPERVAERRSITPDDLNVGTGFRTLDRILEGGVGKGELAAWMADAKTGKTTMLVNHGVAAVRKHHKRVLHVNLEGHLSQINARYDAAFSGHAYSAVKFGNIDEAEYARVQEEYSYFRKRLVVRSFAQSWDTTILSIEQELQDLALNHQWHPDLIVVDYGDILKPRDKHLRTEREKQKASWQDLKQLANRGYAVWTASQSQRPKEDDAPRVIKRSNVADAYDKIRTADFFGSLNSTAEERQLGIMRVYAELYRDNNADELFTCRSDFATMTIREEEGLVSPHHRQPEKRTNGYGLRPVGASL